MRWWTINDDKVAEEEPRQNFRHGVIRTEKRRLRLAETVWQRNPVAHIPQSELGSEGVGGWLLMLVWAPLWTHQHTAAQPAAC